MEGEDLRIISKLPRAGVIFIWVFPKIGVPPKSSILIGFSTIFTIHFGGFSTPIFGSTPIYETSRKYLNLKAPKPRSLC